MVITSALHAEGPQFDPGRDQNFLSRPNCKYQDQYWIVFNISKLSYSAHLCHPKLALPHHKHYRGSVSPDVSARHYPAVLSHTHRDRVAYNVPILVGTGSPVWKEILLRYSSGKCLHSLLVPISGSRSQEFGWEKYQVLDSLVVRISACHVEGPGSIPGRGGKFFHIFDTQLK